MTAEEERTLGTKIDSLSTAVTTGQTLVAGQIGGLSASVDALTRGHELLEKTVSAIGLSQAGCPGRTGVPGVNARLRKIEERISGAPPANTTAGAVTAILRPLLPWLVAAAIGIGAYLASGGDMETAVQVLDEVGDIRTMIRDMKADNDEAASHTSDPVSGLPYTATAPWSTSDQDGPLVPLTVLP